MRDFDELLSQDRTFKVGGEVFTWRDVRPEVLALFDMPFPEENGKKDPDLPKKQATYVWDLADAQILLFIVPQDHERWKDLRKREDGAVTIQQIEAIVSWLMEQQTGRPLATSGPSQVGPGPTATSSTGG